MPFIPDNETYTTGFIPETPTQITPENTRNAQKKGFAGIVSSTADFFGIKKAGQGLATSVRELTGQNKAAVDTQVNAVQTQQNRLIEAAQKHPVGSAERKRLLELADKAAKGMITQEEIDEGTTLSNKEVIGSFGNVALNVATAGLPGPKGTSAVGNIVKSAGQGAAVGAGFGAAGALEEDDSLGDVALGAAKGAATGGVISGTLSSVSELAKVVANRQNAAKIYDYALETPKNVQKAGKSPAGAMLDERKIGTKAGLLKSQEAKVTSLNKEIQTIIKDKGSFHDSQQIFATIKSKVKAEYGLTLDDAEINKLVDGLPLASLKNNPALDTATLNKIKIELNKKYLGNKKWLNSALEREPERITALKAAYNTLADTVKAQDDRLPGLFTQESEAIAAINSLDDALAKNHVMTNLIEILASTGVGAAAGGMTPKAIATALGTFFGLKAATSAPVLTTAAVSLDKAGNALRKKPGAVGQAVRTAGRVVKNKLTSEAGK